MGPVANLRLLLDTHTLLWWVANHPALSAAADHALNETSNDVFVSAGEQAVCPGITAIRLTAC